VGGGQKDNALLRPLPAWMACSRPPSMTCWSECDVVVECGEKLCCAVEAVRASSAIAQPPDGKCGVAPPGAGQESTHVTLRTRLDSSLQRAPRAAPRTNTHGRARWQAACGRERPQRRRARHAAAAARVLLVVAVAGARLNAQAHVAARRLCSQPSPPALRHS
jgi:hypothetical protein